MIIDCFTFFNELDLLEARLNILNNYVDKFILVEAGKTQSLIEKPLYFELNKARYSKFLDKIVHVKVKDYPNNQNDIWAMENHQRNCIKRGLEEVASDDDTIIISDLDEIPNPKYFNIFKDINFKMASFEQDFFAYYLNLKGGKWIGSVAIRYGVLKNMLPQNVRNHKDHIPTKILDGGWHFSWLGGAENVWKKSISCIEPFDKAKIPSKEEFVKFFEEYKNFKNHFFVKTENLTSDGKSLEKINIDSDIYPEYILNNKAKFEKFIL